MEHLKYNTEHDIQYQIPNDDAAADYDGQDTMKSSNNSILKDMNLPTYTYQPPSTTMYLSDISTTPSGHQKQCKRKRSAGSNSATKRFITNMSLICTVCTIILFSILALFYSEWGSSTTTDLNSDYTRIEQSFNGGEQYSNEWNNEFTHQHNNMMHRQLEQDNNNNNNQNQDVNTVADGDYSSYRCDDIFTNTQSTAYSSNSNNDSSSSTTKRCQYASTCDNGDGVLLPFVFCHTNVLSTVTWLILLSPILLLALTLLFRLLGSTAEEYFSPSLEMFSIKLGLPPRFAGVTLLALGNGAADVSATMNAIANDPENGYKMSLGALTGAAMFITTVVAGSVILANDGVACRGALVRDVTALGVSVVVVALNLEKGEITAGVSVCVLQVCAYVCFELESHTHANISISLNHSILFRHQASSSLSTSSLSL